jgi:uncharacterized protein with HEPN domain
MPRDYRLYLDDILEAIRRVSLYVEGLEYAQFVNDTMRVDAVTRNMQIIGEATRHLPSDLKARYSHIAWRDIVGLRNIVTHSYFSVNIPIMWRTIEEDLPVLRDAVEKMLQDANAEENMS